MIRHEHRSYKFNTFLIAHNLSQYSGCEGLRAPVRSELRYISPDEGARERSQSSIWASGLWDVTLPAFTNIETKKKKLEKKI